MWVGGWKRSAFRMHLNLSDHQLKVALYAQDVIYEPRGNPKPNINSRYTEDKEKGCQYNIKEVTKS